MHETIAQSPVLRMANASLCAFGEVLLQEINGCHQLITYVSRTPTPVERKASSAYGSECVAIVFGVEKFCLYQEHCEFLLETDNQAFSWLRPCPHQLGKKCHWIAKITFLKFKITHIRGSQNVIADSLSRKFEPESFMVKTSPFSDNSCTNFLTNFPLAYSDISTHQRADPTVGLIIRELEIGVNSNQYCLNKTILCLKNPSGVNFKFVKRHLRKMQRLTCQACGFKICIASVWNKAAKNIWKYTVLHLLLSLKELHPKNNSQTGSPAQETNRYERVVNSPSYWSGMGYNTIVTRPFNRSLRWSMEIGIVVRLGFRDNVKILTNFFPVTHFLEIEDGEIILTIGLQHWVLMCPLCPQWKQVTSRCGLNKCCLSSGL